MAERRHYAPREWQAMQARMEQLREVMGAHEATRKAIEEATPLPKWSYQGSTQPPSGAFFDFGPLNEAIRSEAAVATSPENAGVDTRRRRRPVGSREVEPAA